MRLTEREFRVREGQRRVSAAKANPNQSPPSYCAFPYLPSPLSRSFAFFAFFAFFLAALALIFLGGAGAAAGGAAGAFIGSGSGLGLGSGPGLGLGSGLGRQHALQG